MIDATLVGAPRVPADHVWLVERTTATMVAARDEHPSTDALAVALVVQTSRGWLASTYDALAHLDTTKLPAHATLITYDDRIAVRPALGRIDDYQGEHRRLGAAVDRAIRELDDTAGDRRAIVVIGDGEDDDPAAPERLVAAKKRAAEHGIGVFAVTYQLGEGRAISRLVTPRVVATPADLVPATLAIVKALDDRYEVRFPADALRFDGRPHALSVRVDTTEVDEASLVLPERTRPGWLDWRAIAGAVAILAGLAVLSRARVR